MGEVVMADLAAKIDALGRFLLTTHQHEARPDETRPWLLRRDASCSPCGAALGPESAP